MNNDNICRICWKRKDTLFSLFRSRLGASPYEKLVSKTNLKIEFSDAGPSSICSQCLIDLDTTLSFLEKCEQSNQILAQRICRVVDEESANNNVCGEFEVKSQPPQRSVEVPNSILTVNCYLNDSKNLIKRSDVKIEAEITQKCSDCGSKRRCRHWAPPSSFTCQICDKVFNKKYNFQVHLKRHRGERDCACPQCGLLQLTESLAQRHCQPKVLRHCPVPHCGKTFTNNTNLRIHTIAHTGEKPFECHNCGKGFSSKKTLTGHMRVHTGEKPYVCQVCGRRFAWNHVAEHEARHAGAAPRAPRAACPRAGCARSFASRAALRSHARSHAPARPYACGLCGASYKYKQSLNKHTRKRHLAPDT